MKVSISIVTDPGPVKTFLTLSDVTLDVRFQFRTQTQQLFLQAIQIRQDKINGHRTKQTNDKVLKIFKEKQSERTVIVPFVVEDKTENWKLLSPE